MSNLLGDRPISSLPVGLGLDEGHIVQNRLLDSAEIPCVLFCVSALHCHPRPRILNCCSRAPRPLKQCGWPLATPLGVSDRPRARGHAPGSTGTAANKKSSAAESQARAESHGNADTPGGR